MQVHAWSLMQIETSPLPGQSAVICMADARDQLAVIKDAANVTARLDLIFNDTTDEFLGVIPTAEIVDSSNDFGGWYRAPGWRAASRRKRLMPTVILYGRWYYKARAKPGFGSESSVSTDLFAYICTYLRTFALKTFFFPSRDVPGSHQSKQVNYGASRNISV